MKLIRYSKLLFSIFLNFFYSLLIHLFIKENHGKQIIYIFIENNHYREITYSKILKYMNIKHILIYKKKPNYLNEIISKNIILKNNFLFFCLYKKKQNYPKILLISESYQGLNYLLNNNKKTIFSIYDASFGRKLGLLYEFCEKMLLKLENNFIFRDPRFINIYNLNKKIKNYCIILDSIGRNYYPSLKSVKNKKALSIGWIDGNTCSIRSSIDDLLNHGFEIIIQTNNVDEINFLNKRYKAVIGSKISFVDKINFNNFDHSDISIGICPHDNLNEIYVKNNELIYTKNAGSSRVMDYLFMGLDIVISDKVKFQNKIINFSGCKTINILNLKKILHKYDYKNNVRLKSRIFSVELYAKKLNKVINEIN